MGERPLVDCRPTTRVFENSTATDRKRLGTAVIVPCYNEEAAIARVVIDFKTQLPHATIFVYDNNSVDATRAVATKAGALVRTEARQGKGNVVRRMFADIDADIYVMVDGDGTYDAAAAPSMIRMLIDDHLDMVVGCREGEAQAAYRRGHRLGNAMFSQFLHVMFGRSFSDVLSGYRVFSRRFVKSFPALSTGFEIETEIAVHALSLRIPTGELLTDYGVRPRGSTSKLSTYKDGLRILNAMFTLFRQERPAIFFGLIAFAFAASSLILAIPIVLEFLRTGLVPRLPTAVLSTGLMIFAMLSLTCGLILDTVSRGRREVRRLAYLAYECCAQQSTTTSS